MAQMQTYIMSDDEGETSKEALAAMEIEIQELVKYNEPKYSE